MLPKTIREDPELYKLYREYSGAIGPLLNNAWHRRGRPDNEVHVEREWIHQVLATIIGEIDSVILDATIDYLIETQMVVSKDLYGDHIGLRLSLCR